MEINYLIFPAPKPSYTIENNNLIFIEKKKYIKPLNTENIRETLNSTNFP